MSKFRYGLFYDYHTSTDIPDALLYFNGRPDEEVVEMESNLECECMPNSIWGYESLPVYAHYLRTAAGKKSVLNMTGRFNVWANFGGLRTAEGLEYDLFYCLNRKTAIARFKSRTFHLKIKSSRI